MIRAAEWRIAMADAPDAATQSACSAWLEADPSHARAYDRLVRTETCLKDLRDAPGVLALRHEALARATLGRRRRRLDQRRWRFAFAAAAALVLVIGPIALWSSRGGLGSAPVETDAQTYATAVGQRMILTLQDGSHVTLNTASRLRVVYAGGERRLYLDAGQAWFDVARDPAKPFRVFAGDRIVTAHGTEFDVRLAADSVQVLLAEGRVSVDARTSGPSAASVMLAPNDLLVADASGVTVQRLADIADREGWRDGVVVFDDAPLSEAAAEINRYAGRRLVLEDADAGRVRISGVYRIGGEIAFARALEKGFGLSADESRPDRITLSTRR